MVDGFNSMTKKSLNLMSIAYNKRHLELEMVSMLKSKMLTCCFMKEFNQKWMIINVVIRHSQRKGL